MNNRKLHIFILAILLLFSATAFGQTNGQRHPANDPSKILFENSGELNRSVKRVRSLIRLGNYDAAAKLINNLKKEYGELPQLNDSLKEIYKEQKNYSAMIEIIRSELNRPAAEFRLWCELGEAYFLNDQAQKADSIWNYALSIAGGNQSSYMILAHYLRTYSFYDEAIDVYRRARAVINKPDAFSDEIVDIYVTRVDYISAVNELLYRLKVNPSQAERISNQIGSFYEKSENPGQIYKQVIEAAEAGEFPALYKILGDMNVRTGDFETAFENYKLADAGGDTIGKYLIQFIQLCYDKKQYGMAITAADYALEKPKMAMEFNILMLKATCLAEIDSADQALAIYNKLEKENSNLKLKILAYMAIGRLYDEKLGDRQAAIRYFELVDKTRTISDDTEISRVALARLHMANGDYATAESFIDKVNSKRLRDNITEEALYLHAELAFLQDDFNVASDRYKLMMDQFPRGYYVNNCLERVSLLVEAAGDSVALGSFADAISYEYAAMPDSALWAISKVGYSGLGEHADFMKAGYLLALGRVTDAVGQYKDYIDSYPDGLYTDRAMFNLAEIYYDRTNQPTEADILLNRLVSEFPTSPLLEKARAYLNLIKAS